MKSELTALFSLLFFLAVGMAGCGDAPRSNAVYVGEIPGEQVLTVELRLDSNGTGAWVSEEETTPFKWEMKRDQIWLHTNAGGVVPGKITEDHVELTVPSHGVIVFSKTKE